MTSFLIVPLFSGNAVMGFIYNMNVKEGAAFTDELLDEMTRFGEETGTMLQSSLHSSNSQLLSKRELKVMRCISMGDTTKEIADALEISEMTVKQYVKLAIKKLDATNRTHAVAQLIRKGILS